MDLGQLETHTSRNTVLPIKPLKILVWLRIVLSEFLHDILAYIAEVFLDFRCNLQLVLRRDVDSLSSFSQQIENELGDIAACDGDVLNRTADNVPFCAGNNVCDTVSRVNNGPSEGAVGDTVGGPRCGQRKDSLHCNVEAFDVERLEHDLGCLFSVLRGIQRRLCLIIW